MSDLHLKIESDGTGHGTRVWAVDEDGTEHRLCGVTGASWSCPSANEVGVLTLTAARVPILAMGKGDIVAVDLVPHDG